MSNCIRIMDLNEAQGLTEAMVFSIPPAIATAIVRHRPDLARHIRAIERARSVSEAELTEAERALALAYQARSTVLDCPLTPRQRQQGTK